MRVGDSQEWDKIDSGRDKKGSLTKITNSIRIFSENDYTHR